MANRLTMAEIDRILTLHTTEHSNREIADLLGINRETVGKYVARAKRSLKKAFRAQMQGLGFGLVELLSTCASWCSSRAMATFCWFPPERLTTG